MSSLFKNSPNPQHQQYHKILQETIQQEYKNDARLIAEEQEAEKMRYEKAINMITLDREEQKAKLFIQQKSAFSEKLSSPHEAESTSLKSGYSKEKELAKYQANFLKYKSAISDKQTVLQKDYYTCRQDYGLSSSGQIDAPQFSVCKQKLSEVQKYNADVKRVFGMQISSFDGLEIKLSDDLARRVDKCHGVSQTSVGCKMGIAALMAKNLKDFLQQEYKTSLVKMKECYMEHTKFYKEGDLQCIKNAQTPSALHQCEEHPCVQDLKEVYEHYMGLENLGIMKGDFDPL